ncbi:MAG: tetratricopeptide repeat protein [Desulfurivibrionaceae bacterium]
MLFGFLLAASFLFAGCAVSNTNATQPAAIYHPKPPQGVTTMAAAEEALTGLLEKAYSVRYGTNPRIPNFDALTNFINNQEGELGRATGCYYGSAGISCDVAGIGISGDRLVVPLFPVYFDELAGSSFTVTRYGIEGLPHNISISISFQDEKAAQEAADLLFFIQQKWESIQKEKLIAFEKKAALYRSLRAKPDMGEEQRKLIVQANAFSQEKNYAKAISLYQKAIEVDPVLYPQAYFNLALLSAQVQRFKPAIAYMKQYLLLMPDAKDARAAQDKIYEWEARAAN